MRGIVCRWAAGLLGCWAAREREDERHVRRTTHHARLHHLNTIHSTPIIATRSTDSPIWNFRSPAVSPSSRTAAAPGAARTYVSPSVLSAPGGGVTRLTTKSTTVQTTNSSTA